MRRLAALLATAGLLAACGGSGGGSNAGTTATAVGGANGAHATATTHTATAGVKPPKALPQTKAAHDALAAFAACMRAHGQNLPPPAHSGGALFDLSHVKPSSAAYINAAAACRHTLSALTQQPKTHRPSH